MTLTIKEKIKDREMWIRVTKRVLCTLSFVVFCLLDQIVGSATGTYQQAMRDYTLVAVGVITLCAYRPEDFLEIPYLVWSVTFFTIKPIAFFWIRSNIGYLPDMEPMSWAIWIFGIVYIRIFYQYVVGKKKPEMNWPLFGGWLVMMTCMVLSQLVSGNDEVWPLRFLFAFGAFYLTNYSRKDLNMLFTSLVDGVIIGFFIIQGQAWLHRPYDKMRYEGMYSNCNMNALFYLVVLCAVLCKWYQAKMKKNALILRFTYVLLTGILIGLIFLTMSRTSIAIALVISMFFLMFQVLSRRKHKMRELMLDGMAIVLGAVLCFVPTYYMVRYLPAYYNDPIFFEGDANAYDMKIKVQKDDPIDSDKYIDLKTAIYETIGRYLWFVDFGPDEISKIFHLKMTVHAAELDPETAGIELEKEYIEPGSDSDHPILTDPEDISDPVKVRLCIYGHYIRKLNLFGHSQDENGVWVRSGLLEPHAHNLLLQMLFNFGVPVGAMFFLSILFIYVILVREIRMQRSGIGYFLAMILGGFTSIFVLFGMMEVDWTYGQIIFSLFFVAQYLVYHKWTFIKC